MHCSLCKVHITLRPNWFCSVQFRYLKCFLHMWISKTGRMKFIDRLNHPQTIVPRDVHVYTHTHAHKYTHTHTHSIYGTSLSSLQTQTCLILPQTRLTQEQNTPKVYPLFRLKYFLVLSVNFHHTDGGN